VSSSISAGPYPWLAAPWPAQGVSRMFVVAPALIGSAYLVIPFVSRRGFVRWSLN